MLSDDAGSIKGKGAEILLPPQGNPFEAGANPAVGDTPDLSPAEVAAMFGGPPPAAVAETQPVVLAAEPEAPGVGPVNFELAASASLVETTPVLTAEAAPVNPVAVDPEPLSSSPSAEVVMPDATVPETAPVEAAPAMAEAPGVMESPAPVDPTVAAPAAPPAAEPAPVAAAVAPPPATAVTAAPADQPGMRVTAGGGESLSQDIGPASEAYVAAPKELTADEALVGMFVPDDRLMMLWLEVDDLEKRIAQQAGVSERVAGEFFDRLQSARNMLMHNRDQYEEANREVVQVRYRLAQIQRSGTSQNSRVILIYLVVVLVVLLAGFLATGRLVTQLNATLQSGPSFELIWHTILWGGVGGLTGAMYSLWRHVADRRDYDPQFALWYYTNPVMGVVLGGFVYVLLNMIVLLAKGLPGALSTQAGTAAAVTDTAMEISPYLMYFFAWVVGFQQNFVFRLVDQVLKQVMPADKDAEKK